MAKKLTPKEVDQVMERMGQGIKRVKEINKDLPTGDNFEADFLNFREPKTLKAVSKAKKYLMKVPKAGKAITRGAPNSMIVGFAAEQANRAMSGMGPRVNRKMPKGKKA